MLCNWKFVLLNSSHFLCFFVLLKSVCTGGVSVAGTLRALTDLVEDIAEKLGPARPTVRVTVPLHFASASCSQGHLSSTPGGAGGHQHTNPCRGGGRTFSGVRESQQPWASSQTPAPGPGWWIPGSEAHKPGRLCLRPLADISPLLESTLLPCHHLADPS